MPKCTIDGREAEFKPGENLVEVAKRVGIEIPVFCYHPGLSVVAQCRMCAIEVEKMPKLQTACSTAAAEGMVVKTKSDRVVKNQKSVMEFLLVNHPLDCPICDKSGECDLQDNSFKYGESLMRTTEERRAYVDLDMGPVIQKNMNRCIHCTRCIRFGDEIAGIREMVAIQRGNATEITTISGLPLETEYAGNYSDICPTGSLTLKDFRFRKRAWMLKKTATVCEGCAKGCNMEIQSEADVIYRCVPRENLEVNRYWLCDEGRFNYRYLHDPARVVEPAAKSGGEPLSMTSWEKAMEAARAALQGRKVAVLAGTDLTQEEAQALQQFTAKQFPGAPLLHFGTPGVKAAADDQPADKLLKRTSKTSNLHGFDSLGIKPFDGKLPAGIDAAVVFRGGRAQLPELGGVRKVGVGVFMKPEADGFDAVLPGEAFAEKAGTVVNHQGKAQKFKKAVQAPGRSKGLPEILMMWAHGRAGAGAA